MLALEIARLLRLNGDGVISLSPKDHEAWRDVSDFHLENIEDFSHVVDRAQFCFLFIDEAGDWCTHPAEDYMNKLARKYRHEPHYHSTFFIAQRLKYVAPSIRSQCRRLYCFRIGPKEAAELAEEWVCEDIKQASTLPFGHYLQVSFDGAKRGQVDKLVKMGRNF